MGIGGTGRLSDLGGKAVSPDASVQALYGLLGISVETGYADVKRAFRFASRANHPDRNPDDPFAPQRFRAINGGWELVNTADKWEAHRARVIGLSSRAAEPTPHGSSRRQRSQAPPAPSPGCAVRVDRVKGYGGGDLGGLRVILDGARAAVVKMDQSVRVELTPGRHELYMRSDLWSRSLPITVDLAPGEEAVVTCSLSAWKMYLSPKQAITLERVG
jgi:hypothetical protein